MGDQDLIEDSEAGVDARDEEPSSEVNQVENEAETLSPLGIYQPGMNWNAVEKVIFQRRSTRSFKKEPLPDNMIRRILEAGRFAPSAGNGQPWKFIVVKSPEIIAEMEKDAENMAKRVMNLLDYTRSRIRRIFLRPFARFFIARMYNELAPQPFAAMRQVAAGKLKVFFNAPTLILVLIDSRGMSVPSIDSGIAGQNMVLAAHSMGASTCWIGMVSLIVNNPLGRSIAKKWKKFFGINDPYDLRNAIALGWPKARFDGAVPREVQLVDWYEGSMSDAPRVDQQGEEE